MSSLAGAANGRATAYPANLRPRRAFNSASESRVLRRRILLLAVLPACDAITNQLNTAFEPKIGSLSMLQVLRGTLLPVLVYMLLATPRVRRHSQFGIGTAMPWLLICIALMAINQVATGGSVSQVDITGYLQMAYWILVWYAAHSWIRDSADARAVLNGLVAGAIITAASVCYGYIAGIDNSVYELEGVKASSGFFVSGKGIAGTLVVGGIAAAYLGIARKSWRHPCLAVFCFGACFLTYARAGLMALSSTLLWLLIWAMFLQSRSGGPWVRRVFAVAVVGAGILVANIGVTDLIRRWSDLNDPSRAGSGRLVIWTAAAESFNEATLSEQLAGRGYLGTVEFIDSKIGSEIHTHNDVLDMLVMGGIVGIVFLLLVFAALAAPIVRTPIRSPEFAAAVSVLLALLFQAIFTGQMFMPDVMTYYVVGITAFVLSTAPPLAYRLPFAERERRRSRGVVFTGMRLH